MASLMDKLTAADTTLVRVLKPFAIGDYLPLGKDDIARLPTPRARIYSDLGMVKAITKDELDELEPRELKTIKPYTEADFAPRPEPVAVKPLTLGDLRKRFVNWTDERFEVAQGLGFPHPSGRRVTERGRGNPIAWELLFNATDVDRWVERVRQVAASLPAAGGK